MIISVETSNDVDWTLQSNKILLGIKKVFCGPQKTKIFSYKYTYISGYF